MERTGSRRGPRPHSVVPSRNSVQRSRNATGVGNGNGFAKRATAVIIVILVVSLGVAAPVVAKEKPNGLPRVDLHAVIACTGLELSVKAAFLFGQPPDPGLLFNIITGFTRSKTMGAHKQAVRLRLATGKAQLTAINNALKWCKGHGYTLQPPIDARSSRLAPA